MTEEEIKKIIYARERLTYWAKRVAKNQSACAHPLGHTVKTPRSLSGYSEPTEYWYDCRCLICERHWVEPQ